MHIFIYERERDLCYKKKRERDQDAMQQCGILEEKLDDITKSRSGHFLGG